MAIVNTLTQGQFIEAFKQSSRADQFSYEALEAIFEWLEEYSDSNGEDVEFDIVAICCDWQEATWQEVAEQYSVDLSDVEEEDKPDAVYDFLVDETIGVYRVSGDAGIDNSFVFVAF